MAAQAGVRGEHGMVATSHPLAARAGLDALRVGGSAADAAVAAAAVLCVVDPRSTGVGGDAFALVWPPGAPEPSGLAGAGPAPAGLTLEALRAAGFERMPDIGPWTVTVPGSVSAWERLLARYGRLGLDAVLEPAIRLAEDGYRIEPVIAREWRESEQRLRHYEHAETLYLPGGRPPRAGEHLANPALGELLRGVARQGARSLYHGPVAERIAEAVQAAGGRLTSDDLAGWEGAQWVRPLRRAFRDIDVFEMPPPTQGIVVLEALGILEGIDCEGRLDEEHAAIEATKLALDNAASYVGDPDFTPVPTERLLSEGHLLARRAAIDMGAARHAEAARPSDTVYVAAVDDGGGACSLIQSLYEGFGSGIAVPGTGLLLQSRGSGFVMRADHPNAPGPRKRPYHTIIPAMLSRGGAFLGCLGVVGGFMQPQGQVQILRNLLDRGLDLQAAIDAPRVRAWEGRRVGVEAGYPRELAAGLERRGHEVDELSPLAAGGVQAILAEAGALTGASDRRKDGCALGW